MNKDHYLGSKIMSDRKNMTLRAGRSVLLTLNIAVEYSHTFIMSLLEGGSPQPLCYWSNQPPRKILTHSLLASLYSIIAADHTAYMPRLKGGGPKYITAEQTAQTQTSPHDITPYQGLDEINPNNPLICLTRPASTLEWTPNPFIPVDNRPTHPFSQLVNELDTSIIKAFSQGSHSNIIAHLKRTPDICVTVGDFWELISHGSLINHELLTLSLEVICTQNGTKNIKDSRLALSPALVYHIFNITTGMTKPTRQTH
jgi:hypothetical protein